MAKGAARSPSEKPTSLTSWRKGSKPELVELPSGKRALLKRPSAFGTMARGEIPNPLLKFAMEAIGEGVAEGEEPRQEDAAYASYILFVCSQTFVEPRFWAADPDRPNEKPPSDALTVDDVDDGDLIFVFSWSQGVRLGDLEALTRELAPFLGERAVDGDGEGGADVQPAAVGIARD
jgi:hypothetical protein